MQCSSLKFTHHTVANIHTPMFGFALPVFASHHVYERSAGQLAGHICGAADRRNERFREDFRAMICGRARNSARSNFPKTEMPARKDAL